MAEMHIQDFAKIMRRASNAAQQELRKAVGAEAIRAIVPAAQLLRFIAQAAEQ